MTEVSEVVASRLRSIQGLRGVAVLLVVLYHVGAPIGAGYIGVDVFFVISGFVITRLVLKRSAGTMRLSVRGFWAGRVRRLAPALALAILLTLALSVPFSSPVGGQQDIGATAVASVLWVANVALAVLTLGYFADSADQNPLLHMWSLAVEEQFYVAFPILVVCVLWWVRRRGGAHRIHSFAIAVGTVTVLSFAVSVAVTYANLSIGIGPTLAFYAPVTRAWEFGAGALVALWLSRGPVRHALWLSVAGAVVLLAGLVVIDDPTIFPGYVALLPVVGSTLLCLSAGSANDRILASGPMVWIGDRSYGWYLFHWPLIVLASDYLTGPGAALVGLVLADVSLRLVEDPIRHRRRLMNLSAPRLWLVCSVPVVCASLLLMLASSHYWWNQSVEAFAVGVSRGVHPVQSACQSATPLSERNMSACTFGPADDPSPIILVGDSNAGMYADMAVDAAEQAGRRITVATIPSCQVADLTMARPGVRLGFLVDCPSRYDDTIAWLGAQPASTVIVVSGSPAPDLDKYVLVDANKHVYAGGSDKQAAWTASLERAYETIEQQGHRVAAVELIPQWAEPDGSGWSPRSCRLIDLHVDPSACQRRVSLNEMDLRQRRSLAAEREAAAVARVASIEVRDALCAGGLCGTMRNSVGLYSDGAHLTPTGAAMLMPRFVEFMSHPPR